MKEEILFFINSHYMDPITLDEVADAVGLSKYYLSRNFKKMTDCSFCEYLNNKRVDAAAEMLTRSDNSVTFIALQAGFQSISSFNRIFKDVKGCSPKQYRAS